MADGTSTHQRANVEALIYLVNEYGTVEKIPAQLLSKNGFVSVADAKNALQDPNHGTAFTLGDFGKAITGSFVHNTMPSVAAHTGLPDVSQAINQPPPSNAVPTNQYTAGIKDDYAAQYANAPGSGLQDVTPIPGGVQYGTAANGSQLGAPHYGTGPATVSNQYAPTDAPNYNDYINNIPNGNWDYADLPAVPAPFQFKITDFTPQAQKDAATAYSPAFAAIEEAKANAQNNYNVADAVTKGIYSDLNGQIGANADALDKKYAAAKVATQADTKAAQGSVADANKAAMTAIRQQMAKQGLGDYQATTTSPIAQDAAAIQGAIAQTGLNDTTAQGQYNLSADTANTGYQNAATTQGAYARQGLASDLASILSGYDQNKLNLTSDEALKVLDLAQSLSSQDLSLQQLQYGVTQDTYQNQLAAANAQNSLASQQQQQAINAANQAYQNAYNTWKDQTQFGLDAQQEADKQSQYNAGLANDISVAKINAGASAANNAKYGPYGDAVNQITNLVGGDQQAASTYVDAVQTVINQYAQQGIQPKDAIEFQERAAQFARANGLNESVARAAASAIYGSGALSGWPAARQLGSVN